MVGAHTHLDLEMTSITTVLIPTYTEPTQLLDQTIRNDVDLIFFNRVLCLTENIFFTKLKPLMCVYVAQQICIENIFRVVFSHRARSVQTEPQLSAAAAIN